MEHLCCLSRLLSISFSIPHVAPTHVDLALQLEDGGRTIQSFAITSTLWDVLLGFEAASKG